MVFSREQIQITHYSLTGCIGPHIGLYRSTFLFILAYFHLQLSLRLALFNS